MSPLVNGLVLLLATALVSGLVVPFVVNRIQVRNQQRLKTFEADLARQSKIIEEQGTLIGQVSSLLWEFQLTLIAPLYYGQPGFMRRGALVKKQPNPESSSTDRQSYASPYEVAADNYLANAGRLLGSIRATIGGAVRLVPPDQWNILRELYYKELLRLDLTVTQLILEGPNQENSTKWSESSSYILRDFAMILDTTVDDLASALGLKYHAAVRSRSVAVENDAVGHAEGLCNGDLP